jgi:hypothetical protein
MSATLGPDGGSRALGPGPIEELSVRYTGNFGLKRLEWWRTAVTPRILLAPVARRPAISRSSTTGGAVIQPVTMQIFSDYV